MKLDAATAVIPAEKRAMLVNDASPAGITEYGQKFLVRGLLTGPNSDSAGIISVWIILTAETVARFVTAYPEE